MTVSDFRKLALALPETEEGSHMGHPDFRVQGRIFATLPNEVGEFGVLLLTPQDQQGMVQDAPDMFSPVPGGWGKNGSTRVHLKAVKRDLLAAALKTAWTRRMEKNALSKSKPKRAAKAKRAKA